MASCNLLFDEGVLYFDFHVCITNLNPKTATNKKVISVTYFTNA